MFGYACGKLAALQSTKNETFRKGQMCNLWHLSHDTSHDTVGYAEIFCLKGLR